MTILKNKILLFICLALSLVMMLVLSSCNIIETLSSDSTNNTGETDTDSSTNTDTNLDTDSSMDTEFDTSTDKDSDSSADQSGNDNDGGNPEIECVTVIFDTKGGSKIEEVQVEKGGKITKPQDPERLGYTFDGWYIDGEKWSFVGYVATENMTLTASWTPTVYTIEYIGEVSHKNKESYTIEDELELSDSNKSYYDFLGWYEDEGYTKPIIKIEKGTTGNLKIYGKTSYQPLTFTEVEDGYSVTDCDTEAINVVIPDTYNGKPVTSIGEHAFYYCESLTSIIIGNSVTSIGYYAFSYCTGLTSVTIPDSVTSIGEYAFEDCRGIINVTLPVFQKTN